MSLIAVTHSGKFHADDVFAWALIKHFYTEPVELIRTRDVNIIENADIVFDVGGVYAPQARRFDHHQKSYTGHLSSAGMVLQWLKDEGKIQENLFAHLKSNIVDYIDDVDNGRVFPDKAVPCFPNIVDVIGNGLQSLDAFEQAFFRAANVAEDYIQSFQRALLIIEESKRIVVQEMKRAREEKRNYLLFSKYTPWKETYFANGGETDPSQFVIFPNLQGRWQAVAIPPKEHSFDQKKSFPQEWAGKRDEELSRVIGIDGAIFCHKNRFISVFSNQDSLFQSLQTWNLIP